jgi:hypothetical protein
MPKIGPNKVSIDPKAYAARVTRAKKTVAKIDPATKAKLREYYPEITTKDIAKQMLNPKSTLADMKKRIKANPTATPKATTKKAAAKPAPKAPATKRPSVKPAPLGTAPKPPRRGTATPAPLKGPAAVAEYQRQVSPSGVKKSEAKQKQAIDKKYPGLYKKSK